MCICILTYPAHNAHEPYCNLWPVPLYSKKSYGTYIVGFHSFHNSVCGISHSKKNWAIYFHKCTLVFTHNTHYSCQILMKLVFAQHILKKYSNIKFHENPSSGNRVVSCRTHRRSDMMKLIATFCNFVNVPKNGYWPGPPTSSPHLSLHGYQSSSYLQVLAQSVWQLEGNFYAPCLHILQTHL